MPPDRLLFDKSLTISSSRPSQFEGISPDRLLFDKSRKEKFFISLMDGGMVPFRRLLERSRRFSIYISLLISKGIDPVSKLFLTEGFDTFDQSGNEPSSRLNPKLIHAVRTLPTCIDLGSSPFN